MTYVALLRGINVGGKNKIEMRRLKGSFEHAGIGEVETYINSGNIVFAENDRTPSEIESAIEKLILDDFGLEIPVVLRSFDEFESIARALPDHWTNDSSAKSDVLFLWKEIDNESLLEHLTVTPDVDEVRYIPGALLWSAPREHASRSGLMQLARSHYYRKMTVRNVNTTRAIYAIMQQRSERT